MLLLDDIGWLRTIFRDDPASFGGLRTHPLVASKLPPRGILKSAKWEETWRWEAKDTRGCRRTNRWRRHCLLFSTTFSVDPDTHIDSLEQAEQIVLEGTSKWSCKIAITGETILIPLKSVLTIFHHNLDNEPPFNSLITYIHIHTRARLKNTITRKKTSRNCLRTENHHFFSSVKYYCLSPGTTRVKFREIVHDTGRVTVA